MSTVYDELATDSLKPRPNFTGGRNFKPSVKVEPRPKSERDAPLTLSTKERITATCYSAN